MLFTHSPQEKNTEKSRLQVQRREEKSQIQVHYSTSDRKSIIRTWSVKPSIYSLHEKISISGFLELLNIQ